jgi:UDP-galactopyranose mutase
MEKADILIVGAGLSGATIAREYADAGISVLVIDKRSHIGGNVYDFIDKETGIRMSQYGAHLFHTDDVGVWLFVQRFGEWKRWDHRVLADVSGSLVPVPVNINTVNGLFGAALKSSEEMDEWLASEQVPISEVKNSEDVARKRVGDRLYELMFKPYTVKQWAKTPAELEPSVLERIPVRNNFDDRYFSDRFQALPVNGYTNIVKNMLDHPNITVKLECDWSGVSGVGGWREIVFTGPIDVYFKDKGLPPLEYRSINFDIQRLNIGGRFYQPNSVVNYPSASIDSTRCVEYKHFLNQKSEWTVLAKETTCAAGPGAEPYYPVPTQVNRDAYKKYAELAAAEESVHFVGRLASYKYFNMDQAIRNSLDYFRDVLRPKIEAMRKESPKIVISELTAMEA